MPPAATNQNMAKIFKSYILTPPHPQGHMMSVKFEQPLDELTVQVWLLYHHQNLKKRNYGQTDDPITRCPQQTFHAICIKMGKYKLDDEDDDRWTKHYVNSSLEPLAVLSNNQHFLPLNIQIYTKTILPFLYFV